MTDFIFLGFKITADGDCSHEIKRCLLLGRKAITNARQRIQKQRHHFANKSPCSQSYYFSSSHVWMWELDHEEGWALKNWCFRIVVLEKALESPLDSKKTQSILNEINLNIHWKDWCWSWSSNTLATWWEQLTHWKRPDAGKDWRQKETGMQRKKWFNSITDPMDMNLSTLRKIVDRGAWRAAVHGVAKSWTWLSNWTTS